MVLVEQTVDRLFEDSANIVGAALRFAEIDPSQEDPPEEWIEEMGEDQARKALRVARYANLPHKDVPAGLDIAHKVFTGITKAKLDKTEEKRPINIAFVQYSQTEAKFGEVIIDENDQRKRKR